MGLRTHDERKKLAHIEQELDELTEASRILTHEN
jgi:hypothetical protein